MRRASLYSNSRKSRVAARPAPERPEKPVEPPARRRWRDLYSAYERQLLFGALILLLLLSLSGQFRTPEAQTLSQEAIDAAVQRTLAEQVLPSPAAKVFGAVHGAIVRVLTAADALEYVRFYLRFYPPHGMPALLGLRGQFMKQRIEPRMLPAARRLIQERKDNSLLAIITATNRFLTEPIAAAFGIEHLIATEPQMRDGRFTGDIVGPPCMREGKISWLDQWLAGRNASLADFSETWFYSDSINDLPLLERVTHPVAVDADPRLAEIARQRGWRTLSLR